MALNQEVFRASLSRFMDPESEEWKLLIDGSAGNYPESSDEFGQKWAESISSLLFAAPTTQMVPPVVTTPQSVTSFHFLIEALSLALEAARPDPPLIPTASLFRQVFNSAFSLFGSSLSGMIATNSGGVATPPGGQIGTQIMSVVEEIQNDISIEHNRKSTEVVNRITEVVVAWFKTGTYTPAGGNTIFWS